MCGLDYEICLGVTCTHSFPPDFRRSGINAGKTDLSLSSDYLRVALVESLATVPQFSKL